MTSQPQGEKPNPDRDWTEDFPMENGNYNNRCSTCGKIFTGHKRRLTCKLCANQPATPSADEEINLMQTFDARVWAKEWLRIITLNPTIPTDEGTMISWFSSALMAGYDEAKRIIKITERSSADEEIATPLCNALGIDEWTLPDNRLVVSIRWKDLARQLERDIIKMARCFAEATAQLASLQSARDELIADHQDSCSEKENCIKLQDEEIDSLRAALAERDRKIEALTRLCNACAGTGYQNLIGLSGCVGRCRECDERLKFAARTAAQIIVNGFTPERNNGEWIDEVARIIHREVDEKLHTVARTI